MSLGAYNPVPMPASQIRYTDWNRDGRLTHEETMPHLIDFPCCATMRTNFTGDAIDSTALSLPAGTQVIVTKMTVDSSWMLVATMDGLRSGLVPRQSLGGFAPVLKQERPQTEQTVVVAKDVPKQEAIIDMKYEQYGSVPEDPNIKRETILSSLSKRFGKQQDSSDEDASDDFDKEADVATSYVEVREGVEVEGIMPKIISKMGVNQKFMVTQGKSKLQQVGLDIDEKSGDLVGTVRKAPGKNEFEFKVTLNDGKRDVATTKVRIRIRQNRVRAMADYYEQVFWGLLVSLLLSIVLRYCVLDQAVEKFPWYLAILMDMTFWTYVVGFALAALYFGALRAFPQIEERKTATARCTFCLGSIGLAICMVMVLLQFQIYFGAAAYTLPRTLDYSVDRYTSPDAEAREKSEDDGEDNGPEQFLSDCFATAGGCAQKDVVWSVDADEGPFNEEKFLGRPKWSLLSACTSSVLLVATLVFKNALTIAGTHGSAKMSGFLLDLADVLAFWGLLQHEQVLINYWGIDRTGLTASSLVDQSKFDGNAGVYEMFVSVGGQKLVQEYSIKSHPSYSEAWWNFVFSAFVIGAFKASVIPVFDLIPSNVLRKFRPSWKKCWKIWHQIYRIVFLDVPFLAMRFALWVAFGLEPDFFMTKNAAFITLALLKCALLLCPDSIARCFGTEVSVLESVLGSAETFGKSMMHEEAEVEEHMKDDEFHKTLANNFGVGESSDDE